MRSSGARSIYSFDIFKISKECKKSDISYAKNTTEKRVITFYQEKATRKLYIPEENFYRLKSQKNRATELRVKITENGKRKEKSGERIVFL
jgi:hypothetical protein